MNFDTSTHTVNASHRHIRGFFEFPAKLGRLPKVKITENHITVQKSNPSLLHGEQTCFYWII